MKKLKWTNRQNFKLTKEDLRKYRRSQRDDDYESLKRPFARKSIENAPFRMTGVYAKTKFNRT